MFCEKQQCEKRKRRGREEGEGGRGVMTRDGRRGGMKRRRCVKPASRSAVSLPVFEYSSGSCHVSSLPTIHHRVASGEAERQAGRQSD